MEIARIVFCYARDETEDSKSSWVRIPAKDFEEIIGKRHLSMDDIMEVSKRLERFGWVIILAADTGIVVCRFESFQLISGMDLDEIQPALINGVH